MAKFWMLDFWDNLKREEVEKEKCLTFGRWSHACWCTQGEAYSQPWRRLRLPCEKMAVTLYRIGNDCDMELTIPPHSSSLLESPKVRQAVSQVTERGWARQSVILHTCCCCIGKTLHHWEGMIMGYSGDEVSKKEQESQDVRVPSAMVAHLDTHKGRKSTGINDTETVCLATVMSFKF